MDNEFNTLNLYQIISVLENAKCFVEDEVYQSFVIKKLQGIIDRQEDFNRSKTVLNHYYEYLKEASILQVRCLLTFFKKYELMDFYTYYHPGRIYVWGKKGLTPKEIQAAYQKEINHILGDNQSSKSPINITYQKVKKSLQMK